jgi:hypothetical protein
VPMNPGSADAPSQTGLMRCAQGTMAMTAEKILLLMSVPKIPVRHICGAGVRVVETSRRPN